MSWLRLLPKDLFFQLNGYILYGRLGWNPWIDPEWYEDLPYIILEMWGPRTFGRTRQRIEVFLGHVCSNPNHGYHPGSVSMDGSVNRYSYRNSQTRILRPRYANWATWLSRFLQSLLPTS